MTQSAFSLSGGKIREDISFKDVFRNLLTILIGGKVSYLLDGFSKKLADKVFRVMLSERGNLQYNCPTCENPEKRESSKRKNWFTYDCSICGKVWLRRSQGI